MQYPTTDRRLWLPAVLGLALFNVSCTGFRQLTMDSANRNYSAGEQAPDVLAEDPELQVGTWVGPPPRADQDLLLWFFRPS